MRDIRTPPPALRRRHYARGLRRPRERRAGSTRWCCPGRCARPAVLSNRNRCGGPASKRAHHGDRTSVVVGKSGSVRVVLGGGRRIKKQHKQQTPTNKQK